MNNTNIIEELAKCLEIPDSAYELAEARYKDLGEWFSRKDTHCCQYAPHIYPQGSFRLGTVVNAEEYDLDFGCRLTEGITKASHTQEDLKRLVGLDLEAYRIARKIEEELEEKNRCWRLKYKDDFAFHMDGVPSIPEEESRRAHLRTAMVENGVDRELAENVAQFAGAITDNRSPDYQKVHPDWKVSNSEGYAKWFESRMKLSTEFLDRRAMEVKVAKIDDLPARQWKSPLQKSIQILKCHRDRMFHDSPECKPISIIITTLAAMAYRGEQDLARAIDGILSQMEGMINDCSPRIPNPVNPVEDFADKWYDPEYNHLNLEHNFKLWMTQARSDFKTLQNSNDPEVITKQAWTKYGASLNPDNLRRTLGSSGMSSVSQPTVHVITETPAKPWMRN